MSPQLKPISQSHSDGPVGYEHGRVELFESFLHLKCEKGFSLAQAHSPRTYQSHKSDQTAGIVLSQNRTVTEMSYCVIRAETI